MQARAVSYVVHALLFLLAVFVRGTLVALRVLVVLDVHGLQFYPGKPNFDVSGTGGQCSVNKAIPNNAAVAELSTPPDMATTTRVSLSGLAKPSALVPPVSNRGNWSIMAGTAVMGRNIGIHRD